MTSRRRMPSQSYSGSLRRQVTRYCVVTV